MTTVTHLTGDLMQTGANPDDLTLTTNRSIVTGDDLQQDRLL